jgi:hypothetical protein
MAISKTDESAAKRNIRIRRSTDRLLASLQREHGRVSGKPSEVHARRNEKPSDERYRDNGANERNAPAPVDFHLFQAVSLMDG